MSPQLTGHPGITSTLNTIRRKYWCPHLSHELPAGKLLPLSNSLWSHIAVDFVMNLPVLKGYTKILVIVECVLKGYRLIHSVLSLLRSR